MKTKKTNMWILCEAFTLTGDAFSHSTVHETLAPWAGVYPTREACMDALAEHVSERVSENYWGLDEEDYDVAADVAEIIAGRTGDEKCSRYNYSTDDREIVWQVFPTEVAL